MFCGSRAEVVLRQFLLPDSVERVRTRGLISINFITARSCLQFILGIVAPAEVVSKGIFVTCLCRAFYLVMGLICARFIATWSCYYVLWLQSRGCFAAILFPDSVERFR